MLAVTAVTYQPAIETTIATTAPAVAAAVGDVNNDGIVDVVAIDGASGLGTAYTAQVFTGATSGSFTPGTTLIPTGGQELALGDFNGDGDLDLATASGVLEGNGDGTFKAAVTGFTLPTDAVSFFTGDFNGDGKLDLAVATWNPDGTNGLPTIGLTILLGNGDGTFKTGQSITVASASNLTENDALFLTGDFNGDGTLDIASPFGVMLGNGDGTFKTLQPLPVTADYTYPVLTAGDFNGDGKLDLALTTSVSGPGQIEILHGNGDGTFTDAGPVSVAASGTVTALTAVDLNDDDYPDLIAGVNDNGANPELAVLFNNQDGTFGTPTDYPVTGTPLSVYAADMNGDGLLDLISVDAIAGTAPAAGTTFNAGTVAVLLSNSSTSTTGSGTGTTGTGTGTTTTTSGLRPPDLNVTASENPVVGGAPLTVRVAASALYGLTVPTGTVTLYDGPNTLGTASLRNGRAIFRLQNLPLGVQPLTVGYGGDSNFAPTVSSRLSELVLASLAQTPDLTVAIDKIALPSTFVNGDQGTATIAIINAGNATASGRVNLELQAAPEGGVDASSVPLTVASNHVYSINLRRGLHATVKVRFTVGSMQIGTYRILASLTPVAGITASEILPLRVISSDDFKYSGNAFGDVGSRRNVPAAVTDGAGQTAVISLTGPGTGTFTEVGGAIDLTLGGTTAASRLRITGSHGSFSVGDVTINGSLGSFTASSVNLSGNLNVVGTLGQISLRSVSGGTWAVVGGIGSIRVAGDIAAAEIFAGAYAGRDDVLGTSDDIYTAAAIGSVYVGGSDDALIAAGAAPAPGDTILTGQAVISGGSIGSVTVRGGSASARFLAGSLPAMANLAGAKVRTAGDPRFIS